MCSGTCPSSTPRRCLALRHSPFLTPRPALHPPRSQPHSLPTCPKNLVQQSLRPAGHMLSAMPKVHRSPHAELERSAAADLVAGTSGSIMEEGCVAYRILTAHYHFQSADALALAADYRPSSAATSSPTEGRSSLLLATFDKQGVAAWLVPVARDVQGLGREVPVQQGALRLGGFQHPSDIFSMTCSPDGRYIVTGGWLGRVAGAGRLAACSLGAQSPARQWLLCPCLEDSEYPPPRPVSTPLHRTPPHPTLHCRWRGRHTHHLYSGPLSAPAPHPARPCHANQRRYLLLHSHCALRAAAS
jgi:hypothetical protein